MRRINIGLIALVVAVVGIRWLAPAPAPIRQPAFFSGAPIPMNIAHRGASIERPEHSWDAYDLAISQGADVLELDVRMTKDGVLVVAHDRSLSRVAGVPLEVATSTLAELRDAAGNKAPLPLVEVLARYPQRINIELKEDRPEAAAKLVEVIRGTGRQKSVIVASYHANVLEHFRDASQGEVATSASMREVVKFLGCYAFGIAAAPAYSALQIPRRVGFIDLGRSGFVEFAHRHGLAVHYWTIDDATEMRELLQAGADGIMTNQPALLSQISRHPDRP